MVATKVSRFSLRSAGIALAGLVAAGFIIWQVPAKSAEPTFQIPAPALDETPPAGAGMETAVLAGGCFWGMQGVFQHVKGVTDAVSGYAGGDKATAHYETVSGGGTHHAESVEITYDPSKITFGKLLQVYFSVAHNPTELNYQGPDQGTNYRSTVFARNQEQAKIAEAYIAQLDKTHVYPDKIVTTIEMNKPFFAAEDYHQNFLTTHPDYPYIVYNDLPKIAALKQTFPGLYRDKPVLVKLPTG